MRLIRRMREYKYRQKLDIIKLITAYVKKSWLIILCSVLIAAAARIYATLFLTPLYQANATIYINNTIGNELAESVSESNLRASCQLVNTYITIIESAPVLEKVSAVLGQDYPVNNIRNVLSMRQINDTEFFRITITCEDPSEAVTICNVVAEVALGEVENIVGGSSSKIITYAKMPGTSYYPNYGKNTMIGGFAGGALAIIYITFRYLADIRVKDEYDLEQLFGLPVLSCIPEFKRFKRKEIMKENFIQEAYKKLRTNVNLSLDDEAGCKVIMITSAFQNEGKSATAINLASSYACAGNRVLLLDCDMRKPMIGKLLDLQVPFNLQHLFVNPEQISECIIPSDEKGLEVILSGGPAVKSSELLGSPEMKIIFDCLKQIYDYIIIDASAVNPVTDASVLTPFISGVLLAVRANVSGKDAVARALEQLEFCRVKVLGFALNGVGITNSSYKQSQDYFA